MRRSIENISAGSLLLLSAEGMNGFKNADPPVIANIIAGIAAILVAIGLVNLVRGK